ncbi:hemerythrin domain-containing protein [Roseibium sp.]|uniref:hemerythrin domain-containing protein n=1 Tax=Roseibium sp. TaxID=1936156 RepID=UPI003D0D1ED8
MTYATNLDDRSGLPEEWLFLLKDHPREIWTSHRNLGPMTEFWLERHNGFRRLGGMLEGLLSKFREDQIRAEQFGGRFAPLLQQFLSELHHHHTIEDHHYFPVFMAAEKRLLAGFELLENDHELIHHRIETVIRSANKLFGQLGTRDRDSIRRAADSFAGVSDTLISGLIRHLEDEEDLIVPVILDRGERQLGLS